VLRLRVILAEAVDVLQDVPLVGERALSTVARNAVIISLLPN
jgi:hypothetical protein